MKNLLDSDALKVMRKQVESLIKAKYTTVEQFCWDNNLNKATVSNFLNSKKDFQISTLIKIAKAFDKKLIIRIG